jgi:hypothetical protein
MLDIDFIIRAEICILVIMVAVIYMDLWHYLECGVGIFFGESNPHDCP